MAIKVNDKQQDISNSKQAIVLKLKDSNEFKGRGHHAYLVGGDDSEDLSQRRPRDNRRLTES